MDIVKNQTPATTQNTANAKKQSRLSSMKGILSVIGLTMFFVLVMVGVLISQRQRLEEGPQAPTAPSSRPSAKVDDKGSCTLVFEVPPQASPTPGVTPSPTPSVSPSPSPSPTPSPTPSVSPSPSPTPSVSPSPSPSPTPGVTPSPTPSATPVAYSCNTSCSTDEQCRQANAGYICDVVTETCRLDSNPTSTSCQPIANSYACNSTCTTTAQCQTVNSGYVCDTGTSRCRLASNPSASNCLPQNYTPPPPAVGCNDTCITNADCTNSNHICYTTADGSNRCRLADYANSETCSAPPAQTTTPTQTVAQPTLPQELPQSGPDDWARWLQVGVVTLGVGALLLLLL